MVPGQGPILEEFISLDQLPPAYGGYSVPLGQSPEHLEFLRLGHGLGGSRGLSGDHEDHTASGGGTLYKTESSKSGRSGLHRSPSLSLLHGYSNGSDAITHGSNSVQPSPSAAYAATLDSRGSYTYTPETATPNSSINPTAANDSKSMKEDGGVGWFGWVHGLRGTKRAYLGEKNRCQP